MLPPCHKYHADFQFVRPVNADFTAQNVKEIKLVNPCHNCIYALFLQKFHANT